MLPPLTLDRLRERARKLKRETGIPHVQALEQVAQDAGFRSWAAALQDLDISVAIASTPTASARPLPPRLATIASDHPRVDYAANARLAQAIAARRASTTRCCDVEVLTVPRQQARRVFHRVRIDGHVWELLIDQSQSDFHVMVKPVGRRDAFARSAYWGDCTSLAFMESRPSLSGSARHSYSWHLVKYGNQPTVDLDGISQQALVEAAFQFGLNALGLPVGPPPGFNWTECFASPAYASFAAAARTALERRRPLVPGERPSLPGPVHGHYLAEWHLRALEDRDLAGAAEVDRLNGAQLLEVAEAAGIIATRDRDKQLAALARGLELEFPGAKIMSSRRNR